MNVEDRPTTDLASWKISNGYISVIAVVRFSPCLILGLSFQVRQIEWFWLSFSMTVSADNARGVH